ncbi:hypothetical protein SteCoe_18525 [Stentor coeruleus]|uniref:Uncharacterized protein n=1 Tax=Stentor coeruleus TaxID=5963 RepID=A0A1R2BW72_9CILI|nr:hypothetical protein SteCoe_18525 [Stentor coeruleus]
MFEYLSYYDESFKDIIDHLYLKETYLLKSIYAIYEEVFVYSYNFDYKFQDVVDVEIRDLKTQKIIEHILSLFENLSPYLKYDHNEVKKFWKILIKDHVNMLNSKKKSLNKLENSENMIIETMENCIYVPSMGIFEKLIPSISGIIIGIASSITRAAIIAAATEASAAIVAAATTAWIPIVGWTIFGVTTTASIAWIVYSVLKTTTTECKNYSKKAELGYKILLALKFVDSVNGEIIKNTDNEDNGVIKDKKNYSFNLEFEHKKANPLSACAKVKFYFVQERESLTVS